MDKARFKASIITMKETDIYRESQLRPIVHSIIDKPHDKSSYQYYNNILNQIEACVDLNRELIQAFNDNTDYDSLLERLAEVKIAVISVQEIFNIRDLDLNKAVTIKLQERL